MASVPSYNSVRHGYLRISRSSQHEKQLSSRLRACYHVCYYNQILYTTVSGQCILRLDCSYFGELGRLEVLDIHHSSTLDAE